MKMTKDVVVKRTDNTKLEIVGDKMFPKVLFPDNNHLN